MSFLYWLRNRTSTRVPRGRTLHQPVAPRFRPRLEALEDRWMPSTLTVTNNLDSGPGSLRAEIAAAQNTDTIVFAPSLNGQTITLTSGELLISTGVTIQGPHVTINCGLSRVFEVNASQPVVLSGLGFGGVSSSNGGGILNHTTLTINGCTIYNSFANTYGGAIYNSGTLTINQCSLSYNTAYSGAGIANGIGTGGTATLTNCTLDHNNANNDGGGIANGGTATLTNCTFAKNTAQYGGALFVDGNATATLTNCTLSLNTAYEAHAGGGIYVNPYNGQATLNLINTIVAGNTLGNGVIFASGVDIFGAVATANHNLVGDGEGSSGLFNGANGNIVGGNGMGLINAGLRPLGNYGGPTHTMALYSWSRAIGHADNAQAPAKDERGVTRLDEPGELTDIGAFEL